MYGLIFDAFRTFVIEEYGEETWKELAEDADARRRYVIIGKYDDDELFALIEAAVEKTDRDEDDLVRAFGQHVSEPLMNTYGARIDDEWTALDLVANTEEKIHEAIRSEEGDPPELEATRLDDNTVRLRYGSKRGLCELAAGIAEGIGDEYGEELDIVEEMCMHDGDEECVLRVHRA